MFWVNRSGDIENPKFKIKEDFMDTKSMKEFYRDDWPIVVFCDDIELYMSYEHAEVLSKMLSKSLENYLAKKTELEIEEASCGSGQSGNQ